MITAKDVETCEDAKGLYAMALEMAKRLELVSFAQWQPNDRGDSLVCIFCNAPKERGHIESCDLGHALYGKYQELANPSKSI